MEIFPMSEQTTTVQNPTESAGTDQAADKGATTATSTVLGGAKLDDKGAAKQGEKPADPKPGDTTTTETPEQKTAREAAEAAAKVPEKYEFKLPDGVTLDAAAYEAFTPKFKELGLNATQAQGLVDTYMASLKSSSEASEAAFEQQTKEWEASARADAEIGGAKFDATVARSNKTMSAFGSPELVRLMNTTGFGNHPEFIRFFARVGEKISEDTLHRGGEQGAGSRSIEERLYGKQTA